MGRPLTFVHLSDIHFVKDFSDISKYDLDKGLRHGVLKSLQQACPELGEFDGILISGDIAYAGKVDEYTRAIAWLDEIFTLIKCDPGQLWCVPGNHDVDQSVHKIYPTLTDSYAVLRKSERLGQSLQERLDNSSNGPLLFQPLQTYNEHFGAKYGCPTTCQKPFWEDTLWLNDGSRLRIRGINSAFCSSRADHEVNAPLVVGPMQTTFLRESDVTYLTLCHHPPDWIVDKEDFQQALNADVLVQLFGHKHLHKHTKIGNSVVLSSGAVHPSRSEKQWNPRFYIIALEVQGTPDARSLRVSIYPRVWDKESRSFLAGADLVEILDLPPWAAVTAPTTPATGKESMPIVANRKQLLHQFMLLPYHTQLSILHRLNLFSEEEMFSMPDTQLFVASFERAKQKNLVDALWEAIETEAKQG